MQEGRIIMSRGFENLPKMEIDKIAMQNGVPTLDYTYHNFTYVSDNGCGDIIETDNGSIDIVIKEWTDSDTGEVIEDYICFRFKPSSKADQVSKEIWAINTGEIID